MQKNSKNSRCVRVLSIIITFILVFVSCFWLYFIVERKIYPLKFQEEIELFSNKYDLDFYQVISLIKIESGFNEKAVSNKGAKGLMQLMDSTAKYVAEKIGRQTYDVFNPKDNIEFGCYYLKYLLDKFQTPKTALCAYNAGEGRVNDWLLEKSISKDKKTLDFIPYKETREYIDKFEKTFVKYKKLYKNLLDKQKNIEYYK